MAIQAPTIDADLEAVKAALAGVQPRPGRVLLFGSRARGDARPDSDLDLLVVMPQATLTPQERQQALRSLRAALRPLLPLPLPPSRPRLTPCASSSTC